MLNEVDVATFEKVARLLHELGIHVLVDNGVVFAWVMARGPSLQGIPIESGDIFLAAANPKQYAANFYKVDLEHYLRWKEFLKNPHCAALTKQGKPCLGGVVRLPGSPKEFDPGEPIFCSAHEKQSTTVQLQPKHFSGRLRVIK